MGKSKKDGHRWTPCGGARSSEKRDKSLWHRAYRRAVRIFLLSHEDGLIPHFREYSDPWLMDKDGPSVYQHNPLAREFRK